MLYYYVIWVGLDPNGEDAEYFLSKGLLVDSLAMLVNAGQFLVHLIKVLSPPDIEFLAFDSGVVN